MTADKDEIGAISALGPFAAPPRTKYERLIAMAKAAAPAKTVVVYPCDERRSPASSFRSWWGRPP